MKFLYIAIALLIIGGGYFWYSGQDNIVLAPDTEDMESVNTQNMDEMDNMEKTEDDSVSSVNVDASAYIMSDGIEDSVIEVKGFNYAYDVSTITVNEGDTVTINFESSDGFHDWVVDEFSAATEKVRPGTPTPVTFVADKAGTFEYYCSVGSHRAEGMVGNLIVNPKS